MHETIIRNSWIRYHPEIFATWFVVRIRVDATRVTYWRAPFGIRRFLNWEEVSKVLILKHKVTMLYAPSYFAKRLVFYKGSGRELSINITTRYCRLEDPKALLKSVVQFSEVAELDVSTLHGWISRAVFASLVLVAYALK